MFWTIVINAEIADTCSSVWFKPPELCKNLFTFSKKQKKTLPYTIPPPQKKFLSQNFAFYSHFQDGFESHWGFYNVYSLKVYQKKKGQNINIIWTGSHTTLINRHLPFQFIAVSQMIWCTLKSKQVTAQRWRTTGTCFITLD